MQKILVLHEDKLRSELYAILNQYAEQVGQVELLVEDIYNYTAETIKQKIREVDKVLVCSPTVFKLFFKVRKISGAALTQWWHEELQKPFYYTPKPNDIMYDSDKYVDLLNNFDFCINTPTTKLMPPPIPPYNLINSPHMLKLMLEDIEALNPDYLSVDIETTGLNIVEDEIRFIGIASTSHRFYIIPAKCLQGSFLNTLRVFFECGRWNFVGQNCQAFDRKFVRVKYGIDIPFKFDLMLAHYLTDERQTGHSLDALAAKYKYVQSWKNMLKQNVGEEILNLQIALDALEELIDNDDVETDIPIEELEEKRQKCTARLNELMGDKKSEYGMVDDKDLCDYLAIDLQITHELVPLVNNELQSEGQLEKAHDDLMLPAAHMLGVVSEDGLLLDQEYLHDLDKQHTDIIGELRVELTDMCGFELNPRSPKQISTHLYKTLGIPKKPNRKSSESCTDEKALTELKHPVADKILEIRRVMQINKNFVKKLLTLVDVDGRIRCSLNITGTVTGRLSCSKPNLQQIPSVDKEWYKEYFNIRRAFVSRPGYKIIECDYSQLELRCLAWYCEDEKFIEAFMQDADFHQYIASKIYKCEVSEVEKWQRSAAKKTSFGIPYGIGILGLMEQTGLSKMEVIALKNVFNDEFPGIRPWIESQWRFAEKNQYVETPFGRRRHFPFITNSNIAEVRRQAVNMPIQSFASDLCLTSAFDLLPQLEHGACDMRLLVHDAILFECREDLLDKYIPLIVDTMQDRSKYIPMKLPFTVEAKVGNSWGVMEKYKTKE